ncbi:hypothetical protein [Lactiplantibacillus modestisalitolerans]|uniref:Uncharacterized protein n=1 Tax=Lactiplantibacillus modestisalitolerans TaxID=1457219 RepID=A0ABV5WQN6_9LACO|nr:hypothetical protein [Lactiplantibacillus modestisalitolerans]
MMKTVTELLQTYTFEPVTTSLKFDQRLLRVHHQDRAIPFGHFRLRLKNIDNQEAYELELKQQLVTNPATGGRLRARLQGIRHQATAQHAVVANLTIRRAPKADANVKHDRAKVSCLIPIKKRVAMTLPDQVPLYAFTDNHQLALNQAAMAKLFLASVAVTRHQEAR